jgi:hypothetical protein
VQVNVEKCGKYRIYVATSLGREQICRWEFVDMKEDVLLLSPCRLDICANIQNPRAVIGQLTADLRGRVKNDAKYPTPNIQPLTMWPAAIYKVQDRGGPGRGNCTPGKHQSSCGDGTSGISKSMLNCVFYQEDRLFRGYLGYFERG